MRPRGTIHVKSVLRVGQLGICDWGLGHRPQFLDELLRFDDRDERVVAAVQHEERRRVGPHLPDRRSIDVDIPVRAEFPLHHELFEQAHEFATPLAVGGKPVVAPVYRDGGHLSALAALTPNDPKFQPGFEDADTSVVAAVPVYGRYDWFSTDAEGRREFVGLLEKFVVKRKFSTHRDIYSDASPIRQVRADAPPFFVLHGHDDSLIPVVEAQEFVEELRAVSKSPVAYAELPNAQHAFDIFGSPRAHQSAEAVARFLSWVYATSYLGRD